MIYSQYSEISISTVTDSIQHPFCFHYDGQVFRGQNLSPKGLGVLIKRLNRGEFCFFRGQTLKEASLEIEGETIYISKLKVTGLQASAHEMVYWMTFESIIEPEKAKLQSIYDRLKGKGDE